MHKFGAILAALITINYLAPTAFAFDCETDDDVADCVRSIVKFPPVRKVVPSVPRPSAVLKEECDDDDEDDIKVCLRGLKVTGVGQNKPDLRPAATVPAERKPAEKSETAPASATVVPRSTRTPGLPARVEPDRAPERCQKYFSAVGQLVDVPCGE